MKNLEKMNDEKLNALRDELIEKSKHLSSDSFNEYERIVSEINLIEEELLRRDFIARETERYNDLIAERDEMMSAAYIQQYELGADDEEYQEDWNKIMDELHGLEFMLGIK